MRRVPRSCALGCLATAAVLATLATTTAALAAAPVKGASYTGKLSAPKNFITVSFKVTADGEKVKKIRLSDTPFYCEGGGPPAPLKFKTATISDKNTFSSKATVKNAEGQVTYRAKISGAFQKKGKAKGTVKSTYPLAPDCDGKSSFSATVGGANPGTR